MKRILVLAVVAALLAGCANEAMQRSDAAIAWKKTLPESNADYGSAPKDYQGTIKAYIAANLKDPDSARYGGFADPVQGYAIVDSNRKSVVYGYSACVLVNAKNSYGGYTGNHLYWLLIKNEKVLFSSDLSSNQYARMAYGDDLAKCIRYKYDFN